MLSCVVLFFFLYIVIDPTQGLTNCSALYSFIQVRGEGITDKTLVSKHAHFPPHSYEWISWSKLALVTLTNDDDLCVSSTKLATNITNKIVLLFEKVGNCSAQQKVYTAQQNGAKAVLISNSDVSGTDVTLSSDVYSTLNANITIPMRSISALEADLLSDEITAARNVEVQFGCNDPSIASTLCLMEPSSPTSDYSWFSGNYQRQEGALVNGHPYWYSSGIAQFRNPHEIFLHVGNTGSDHWYWAVADVYTSDSYIELRCAEDGASILHPQDCPQWESTKDEGTTWETHAANLTSGLCPSTGSESVCIASTKYALHGISGTYSQKIPGESMWFREQTECDWKMGVLYFVEDGYFGTNYFELNEPLNEWAIAVCFVTESIAVNKWKPELCDSWLVLNDNDLRYFPDHRVADATFTIAIDSCAVDTDTCTEANTAPDVMCFANNSIMHGSAMGEYHKSPEVGPYFGSPIYKRITYDSETNPLYVEYYENPIVFYIWYTNELWALKAGRDPDQEFIHYKEWVLTTTSLEEALNTGEYDEGWGYCEGYAHGNPFACQGWIFNEGNTSHYDERMSVTDTNCLTDPFPVIPDEWSEYICVDFHNTSDERAAKFSSLNRDKLRGAYVLNTSLVTDEWQVPYWTKVRNDFESHTWWLYWSEGWLLEQDENGSFPWMGYCDPYAVSGSSVDPVACKTWYDNQYTELDNIYLRECTSDDVLQLTLSELCLSRGNDTISSYLEGVYIDNGINRAEYDTVEFISLNNAAEGGPFYLWYHDSGWWISTTDYKSKHSELDDSQVNVYAYCRGGISAADDSPFCEECWWFYYDLTSLDLSETAPAFEDCSFVINQVQDGIDVDNDYYCDADIVYTADDVTKPLSLCIEKDDSDSSDDDDDYYYDYFAFNSLDELPDNIELMQFGEYDFDSSDDNYASKKGEFYIVHDKITNYWLIADDLNADQYLFLCTSDAEAGWLPRDCYVYDETNHSSYRVDNLFSISAEFDKCKSNNGKQTMDESSGGNAAGIVVAVLVAIICVVFMIFLWFKYQEKAKKPHVRVSVGIAETEIVSPGGDNEGGDTNKTYDMSALNPDPDADPLTV